MKISVYTFILFISSITIQAQAVYEPIDADIHEFMDRMNIMGIINIDSEAKPYTRKYIALKLSELSKQSSSLNDVENEELQWYLREYFYELSQLTAHSSSPKAQSSQLDTHVSKRWRLFSYTDSLFQLQVSPVAGYGFKWIGEENGRFQWWGVRAFGTYGDNFAAYIHFTDNGEFGGTQRVNNFLSPEKGRETINVKNGIEFSDVRGSISYDWKWGNITLIKDYFSWGNGNSGNIIFSRKAPSYAHLRLVLKPTDWFRFYYTHGWLTSNVIDSLRSQFNYGIYDSDSEFFIPKYYAANLFVFEPVESVELMVGNSAVYSGDNIRPEFFIPFMFFKYLDRDLGKGSVEDANGQLHFGVNYRPINNLFLYGNILFDVIEIRKTLDAEDPNNWFGFTTGLKGVNLLTDNLDMTIEYTRINPWVYEHKKSATTYKHVDYTLGHWIGQNADLFSLKIDYKFIRSLVFSLTYNRFRKGGLKDISEAYGGDEPEDFLYGPLRRENSIGLKVMYNPVYEVFLNVKYEYSDIDDQDPLRTPPFRLGSNHSFSISLSYGFK